MKKPSESSICFVGLDSYLVLKPGLSDSGVGGESVQHALLAKAFAEIGYKVSVVVQDYGQAEEEVIDGIRLLRTYKQRAGLPVLRFIHPRMTAVISALRKADADIYYQSCAGMLTGLVAWFCKRRGRRFIFRTASDADCTRGQELIAYWRDKKLYEYGLRNATLVAVQGIRQRKLMGESYSVNGIPVDMAVELPQEDQERQRDIDVLWVANMRPLKRPEILLNIASRLAHRRFVVIGGPLIGREAYYKAVSETAQQVKNVEFVGFVPYQKVNQYFARAKLFLNTSEVEGFPNTFLQAWTRGVPTVSFFDPDDIIKTEGLGAAPLDIARMEAAVELLLSDNELRQAMSIKARRYAAERFSPVSVARRYDALIKDPG